MFMQGGPVPSCQRPSNPARAVATDNRHLFLRFRRDAKRGADDPLLVWLATQPELGNQGAVPLDIVATQVVEQPTASSDEHE